MAHALEEHLVKQTTLSRDSVALKLLDESVCIVKNKQFSQKNKSNKVQNITKVSPLHVPNYLPKQCIRIPKAGVLLVSEEKKKGVILIQLSIVKFNILNIIQELQ